MGCGDPGSAKCVGTWAASTAGVMVLSVSSFEPLVAGDQKASLWPVFSIAPPIQAHRGAPLAGVLLCRLVHQALKGAPWVGSYSVVRVCQALDGPASLLFSCRCWLVGRERLW